LNFYFIDQSYHTNNDSDSTYSYPIDFDYEARDMGDSLENAQSGNPFDGLGIGCATALPQPTSSDENSNSLIEAGTTIDRLEFINNNNSFGNLNIDLENSNISFNQISYNSEEIKPLENKKFDYKKTESFEEIMGNNEKLKIFGDLLDIVSSIQSSSSSETLKPVDPELFETNVKSVVNSNENKITKSLENINNILETIEYFKTKRSTEDEYYNNDYCEDGDALLAEIKSNIITLEETDADEITVMDELAIKTEEVLNFYQNILLGCVAGILKLNNATENYSPLVNLTSMYGDVLDKIVSTTSDIIQALFESSVDLGFSVVPLPSIRPYSSWKNGISSYSSEGRPGLVQLYIGS